MEIEKFSKRLAEAFPEHSISYFFENMRFKHDTLVEVNVKFELPYPVEDEEDE